MQTHIPLNISGCVSLKKGHFSCNRNSDFLLHNAQFRVRCVCEKPSSYSFSPKSSCGICCVCPVFLPLFTQTLSPPLLSCPRCWATWTHLDAGAEASHLSHRVLIPWPEHSRFRCHALALPISCCPECSGAGLCGGQWPAFSPQPSRALGHCHSSRSPGWDSDTEDLPSAGPEDRPPPRHTHRSCCSVASFPKQRAGAQRPLQPARSSAPLWTVLTGCFSDVCVSSLEF